MNAWKEVATHAWLDAPLLAGKPSWPVLLLSHGLGVSRMHYTSLAQELASHGYVVLCIDHPYGGLKSLPDGRILSTEQDKSLEAEWNRRTEDWASDMKFLLDQLEKLNKGDSKYRFSGRLNLRQVGVFGHSMGGAAALACSRIDPRVGACADLDGAPTPKTVQEGVGCPALLVRSKPEYSDAELAAKGRTREQWRKQGDAIQATWKKVFGIKGLPSYNLSIRGAGHMSFSDAPFVMPDTITRFGGRIIDAQRCFEIQVWLLRTFFDQYLQGQTKPRVEDMLGKYPQVIVNN
jgi:pimeloyl-ACP methyl ester carboxylesterase